MTGNELQAVRERFGLSRAELGEHWGLRRETIWKYETQGDDEVPNPKMVRILCDALPMTLNPIMVLSPAAEVLERQALMLRAQHHPGDEWLDDSAKAQHNLMLGMAEELTKIVNHHQHEE